MISTTWILYTSLIFNSGGVDNYHERLFTKEMCINQSINYWNKFYVSGMDKLATQDLVCVNEKNIQEKVRIKCHKNGTCTFEAA
jgi:hypothetical protein